MSPATPSLRSVPVTYWTALTASVASFSVKSATGITSSAVTITVTRVAAR